MKKGFIGRPQSVWSSIEHVSRFLHCSNAQWTNALLISLQLFRNKAMSQRFIVKFTQFSVGFLCLSYLLIQNSSVLISIIFFFSNLSFWMDFINNRNNKRNIRGTFIMRKIRFQARRNSFKLGWEYTCHCFSYASQQQYFDLVNGI